MSLYKEREEGDVVQNQTAASPEPSCVSMKSVEVHEKTPNIQ